MAVFYLNNCKFRDCDKTFPTLSDLIQHIEGEHLDFDPISMEHREQLKPQHVPLSYVLRFSQKTKDVTPIDKSHKPATINKVIKEQSFPKMEKEYTLESEISDDSWNDDYSSDNFAQYIKKSSEFEHMIPFEIDNGLIRTKKFLCPVPGCHKRYKNVNGIKYHTKNGHDMKKISPVKSKKSYKCYCGKAYKTIHGIKTHSEVHKELKVHKSHSPASTFSPTTVNKNNNIIRNVFDANKNTFKTSQDDISNYACMEHLNKPNTLDENQNLNALTSFCSYNDSFTDNLYFDDSNNYSTFVRK